MAVDPPEIADYRATVNHDVWFHLDDNGPIVKRSDGRYFRMDWVHVRFPHSRDPLVSAGGLRVAKDGHLPATWGNSSSAVDAPDPDIWIELAREEIHDQIQND